MDDLKVMRIRRTKLEELLQKVYFSDCHDASLLATLAQAVQEYLDSEDSEHESIEDAELEIEKARRDAASSGWTQAFNVVESVVRTAMRAVASDDDPFTRLEEVLEEIEEEWGAQDDPDSRARDWEVMPDHRMEASKAVEMLGCLRRPERKKSKKLDQVRGPAVPSCEDRKPTTPALKRGGKHQIAVREFLSIKGGEAPRKDVLDHLVEQQAVRRSGAYNVVNRMIGESLEAVEGDKLRFLRDAPA